MNEVYGVDPSAPVDASELISLVKLFGPTEGRFIAALPDDWLDQARATLEPEPPVRRERALLHLERARRALIATNRSYRPMSTWAENARALKDIVHELIGPRGCPEDVRPIDEVIDVLDSLPDGRGDHVRRNAKAYVRAAWPLFAISPKVVLVDPYFRLRYRTAAGHMHPAQRQRKVLVELLIEASRRRKVSTVCLQIAPKIALEGDPDAAVFERDLLMLAEEAGATELALEMGEIDEGHHGRYLLGAGCGLQFDHGFDAPNDGVLNHVHWLSAAELRPLLERFDLPEF